MIGTVRQFRYDGPEEPKSIYALVAQRHDGQDVLVLAQNTVVDFFVEALDGSTFPAYATELTDGATTPATRFPSSG